MKLERRVGIKSVYVDFVNGRECRAHTINGEIGAKRIFDIMRATNGSAKTPAMRNEFTDEPNHR